MHLIAHSLWTSLESTFNLQMTQVLHITQLIVVLLVVISGP